MSEITKLEVIDALRGMSLGHVMEIGKPFSGLSDEPMAYQLKMLDETADANKVAVLDAYFMGVFVSQVEFSYPVEGAV